MCVCMCMYTHVCTYTYVCTCVYMHNIYAYIRTYICIYIYEEVYKNHTP